MGKRFLRVLLPALAALFILPFCCTASADSAGVSGIVWWIRTQTAYTRAMNPRFQARR